MVCAVFPAKWNPQWVMNANDNHQKTLVNRLVAYLCVSAISAAALELTRQICFSSMRKQPVAERLPSMTEQRSIRKHRPRQLE